MERKLSSKIALVFSHKEITIDDHSLIHPVEDLFATRCVKLFSSREQARQYYKNHPSDRPDFLVLIPDLTQENACYDAEQFLKSISVSCKKGLALVDGSLWPKQYVSHDFILPFGAEVQLDDMYIFLLDTFITDTLITPTLKGIEIYNSYLGPN